MKRPIILIFPIVTEILLYASAVPIKQNRGNNVASHSVSPYIFPIDSSPTQRSDLDHVLNLLDARSSVKDLLNPETQTAPDAPTSSASHGAGGSANTLPPIHSILSHPDFIHPPTSQDLSHDGVGPAPPALPPQSGTNSHQKYAPTPIFPSPQLRTYVPMDLFHSPVGPPFHTLLLPHHAGIQYQGYNKPFGVTGIDRNHGANLNLDTSAWGGLQLTPPASMPVGSTHDGNYPSSSAPANMAGVSSVTDDPDRLPRDITRFFSLRPGQVTGKLKLEIHGKRTPKEVGEEVVNGMLILKTLFQQALEKTRPTLSNGLLATWDKKVDELSNSIVPESELRLMKWWNTVIHRQMRAIAKLYDGRVRQVEWDRNWIDNLSTTQLKKDRESTRYLDVLRIIGNCLPTYGPINYLKKLESIPHTYEDLLNLATALAISRDDDDINNVLVLRRKAIQMWMLKGMSAGDFVEQKRILRRIVANLDERDINKVRAEMVVISLERFITANGIRLAEA